LLKNSGLIKFLGVPLNQTFKKVVRAMDILYYPILLSLVFDTLTIMYKTKVLDGIF